MVTYTFDDNGKIAAVNWMFDTLLIENMKKRAAEHDTMSTKAEVQSEPVWARVGAKNVAAVEQLQAISNEMLEAGAIDETMMGELLPKMKSFYAPKVSFSIMPLSKTVTEYQHLCKLDNATVDECFAVAFKQWARFKNEKITDVHTSVDIKSGGKVVITSTLYDTSLTDASGTVISSTKVANSPVMVTYTF